MLQLWERATGSCTRPCPQCGSALTAASPDWWRCSVVDCPYEITADAYDMYAGLGDLFEEDPEKFFRLVTSHRDEMRELEPAWLR